jgi:membrane associated rhomboid family serine protease
MSDVTTELKKLIVRPASVAADAALSIAVGIVAFMLLGLIVGILPFGTAMQAAVAGVVSAMVYMRARTNLLDPEPAFTIK